MRACSPLFPIASAIATLSLIAACDGAPALPEPGPVQPPTVPVPPGPPGSTARPTYDLHVMSLDGSASRSVGRGVDPTWAPDGQRIAFATVHAGRWAIATVGADATGSATLTQLPSRDAGKPTWSPTGSQIAFVSSPSSGATPIDWRLHAMHANGTSPVSYEGNWPDLSALAWSPDGRRIAFVTGVEPNTPSPMGYAPVLSVLSLDDGSVKRLAAAGQATDMLTDIAWSPDGRRIALAWASATEASGITVIDADGTGLRRLTDGADSHPSWSPDGRRIAFVRAPADVSSTLMVMTDDGGGARVLATALATRPAHWLPDGRSLLFDAREGFASVRLDGSDVRVVAPGVRGARPSPDGSRIAFEVR